MNIKEVNSSRNIILNIAHNVLLRNVFILSIIVAVAFPLYGIYVVMPSFTSKLINNIEEEAVRTGMHISSMFFDDYSDGKKGSDYVRGEMLNEVQKDFQIEKIKVFSHLGEVIYSTSPEDVGSVNRNNYFHNEVAQGQVFSKIVNKDNLTLEGRQISTDIAEIYVPVMRNGKFAGAFEIYYDISARKHSFDALMFKSSFVAVAAYSLLFCLVLAILVKASKADMKRKNAEIRIKHLNDTLEERVEEQTREIKLIQSSSIEALAVLAEYYDSDTGGHLDRIKNYVRILINHLRDNSIYSDYIMTRPDYVHNVIKASVLHDIGKTAIQKDILAKAGKLTEDEFTLIKKHTEIAGSVLDRANKKFLDKFNKDSYLSVAREIALFHHEKWSGTGYPLGLKEDAIPLSARIVAIADVYDALRSRRPYKPSWSHEKASAEIIRQKGKQFDPVIVDAFIENVHFFEAISSSAQEPVDGGALLDAQNQFATGNSHS